MAPVSGKAQRIVTYADLQQWPEDGRRYELYDGEVVEIPSPRLRHQIVARRLLQRLLAFEEKHGGLVVQAPFDIVFSELNVLQPDLVFFRRSRAHLLNLDEPTRQAPDLAIEVLSPSTESRDRGRKMKIFARYGVPEYWIVDPHTATIEVHSLSNGAYTLAQIARGRQRVRSVTLPGLSFVVSTVFPK